MFKVTLVRYEDLPNDIKDSQPDNGCGRDYANYLKLEFGERIFYESDAMEPEDATFRRDLLWVKDALVKAYQEGLNS